MANVGYILNIPFFVKFPLIGINYILWFDILLVIN